MEGVEVTAENDLNGRHFNYVAFHNPPFEIFTRGPNGTFNYTGSSKMIALWLAEKFNYTIEKLKSHSSQLIKLWKRKLGTHEAAFYQLMNDKTSYEQFFVGLKNIDGITPCFYLTMDRVERFDFTTFIWSEGFRLVVPRSGEESRLFAFIGPFQPMVWMSIFISLLFTVAAMKFFEWFYNHHLFKKNEVSSIEKSPNNQPNNGQEEDMNPLQNRQKAKSKGSLGSHIIYVINTMTNQGGREVNSRLSFRVLAGVWVLCAMVLVNSYTGIVTSSLTTPKMKPSIDSFEDLVASKGTGIVLRSDTAMGVQILEATSGIYKVLADQARSHPDRIVNDPFKLSAKLETGHFAYPFMNTFTVFFVSAQYKKEGKCRFKVSKPLPVTTGYYSMLYKKGTSYTKTISRGLMDLYESGIVRFWVKQLPTIPKADECFANDKRRVVSRPAPIQLTDLTSAFLILGIGIGLATLAFLLETIYAKWKQNV
uniref:Ionotropic glutamate receptor C-terminal domain-containing protein n=1 Tax=Daphnia galeata TaxID=27404 RepID=A0A8J2WJS5_9CRUS|nr:unnamed protein product [Daphnia galeata]